MAARAPIPTRERQEPPFDMDALRRLAVWGSAATLALVVAVAAGHSDPGSRRAAPGSQAPATPAQTSAEVASQAARAAEAEAQARKLADAVRELAGDRERLFARIDTIERNLEDITGSIKRQTAAASGDTAAPAPRSSAAPPAAPGVAVQASSPVRELPPAEPQVLARAPEGTPPTPSEQAAAASKAEAPTEPYRTEFGVDVGGAANFDGLRVLWTSTKGSNAVLFDGLHPIVAVRENSRTKAAELRLVVGPIVDVEAAARVCAALTQVRRYCQPVSFEGQRLAEADVVVERKPAAAPKPAPKPAPPPPSRSPRLFFQ